MMRFTRWIVLALACASACSNGERAESGTSKCDPFAGNAEPIVLGTVLGAGRDSGGTVYVVDQSPESLELRAFAGSQTRLIQQPVAGSSEASEGGLRRYMVTVDVRPRSYALIVEREADQTRMGRALDVDAREISSLAELSPNEQLELIDADALEGAEVGRGPSEAQVEYFARLPSGALLLVTSLPDSADYYGSFRLFHGKPAAVLEREILSVRRGRDGGSTTIEFELDGAPVTASFPVELDGMQFTAGAWTFQLPDETIPLEQLSIEADAERLETAHFECLG